jgi:hypothetical protein
MNPQHAASSVFALAIGVAVLTSISRACYGSLPDARFSTRSGLLSSSRNWLQK